MSFSSGNPVAVLVDAETVDAGDARSAIVALGARFPPLILHAFGDFRDASLQAWCDVLDELDGQALQVTPTAGHHNSVHICLTMNAMEIVHSDLASAICIFCGEGDFSQLAVRVRKAGLPVLGFGTAEAGVSMAPWFDSWHTLDEPGESVFAEDGAEEFSEGQSGDDEPDYDPGGEIQVLEAISAGAVASGSSEILEGQPSKLAGEEETDRDIESAVQAARTHHSVPADRMQEGAADSSPSDEILDDTEVMAAIEGNGRAAATIIENPPPLSQEDTDTFLTEDATVLLDTFISDHENGNGYALLSDVAYAATSTDLLVPPKNKSQPDSYLKQLVDGDQRFEITRLKSGDGESEFIRRL